MPRHSVRLMRDDPIIIGGTPGSGTTVFAAMLERLGMDIGKRAKFNEWKPFGKFMAKWRPALVEHEFTGRPVDFAGAASDLAVAIAQHRGAFRDGPWGFKRPMAGMVLVFLNDCMPDMRYIHVIRDGRDMAISSDQSQVEKVADLLIGEPDDTESIVRSAASWSAANCYSLEVGSKLLADRFFVVRFEDLIDSARPTLLEVARFAGLKTGDRRLSEAAALLEPETPGVGRSMRLGAEQLDAVTRAAEPGLRAFRYLE